LDYRLSDVGFARSRWPVENDLAPSPEKVDPCYEVLLIHEQPTSDLGEPGARRNGCGGRLSRFPRIFLLDDVPSELLKGRSFRLGPSSKRFVRYVGLGNRPGDALG